MNFKVKRELKEFLEFKKKYKFYYKEIIQKGDFLYCDGEVIENINGDRIGESDSWVNVGFKLSGTFSKALSNLFPYEFIFRGKKLKSIENFFQGIKFKDKKIQNMVFEYSGIPAVVIKCASDYDWKKTGKVYWQGKEIDRFSDEYKLLVDELYICAIQNQLYRNVLRNCEKDIVHSMGDLEEKETTFTRYEFEYELNCLKEFLKERV